MKSGGKAQNVIYFLGDGMGTQEITAARYYQYGAAGKMNIDRLLFTGFKTTWSIKPAAAPPYLPDYDPDSASTGTMWATDKKTIDERISQGPSSDVTVPGQNLQTVLEIAKKQGKRTGNVSTAEITDATPAVLDSHISQRACQSPANTQTTCPTETKAAGGPGVDRRADRRPPRRRGVRRRPQPLQRHRRSDRRRARQRQDRRAVGRTTGLREVKTAAELAALEPGDTPVLGLFTGGNMTTEWKGPVAALGDGVRAHTCVTTNRPANEPSPADMTRKALELPAEHAAHRLGRPRVGVRARRGKVLGTTDHTNSFSLLQGG